MTRTQQLPDSLILTVDDHALLREGIAALVNAEPDMKLVAEASNGKEATLQTYYPSSALAIGLTRLRLA
jgi:DNA-binding NarL/FixJ family response regulator